jgi:hypothetical protein
MAQEGEFWLKHPSTHKFPDFSQSQPAVLPPDTADAVQMGPECGGELKLSQMTGIWDFVQQGHNFIAMW